MKPVFRSNTNRFSFNFGPTNSGKTHAALENLKSAKSGFYAAPLRLLAQEVYKTLTDAGLAHW